MAINMKDRLNRWEVLNANLKRHLEEMPDLKPKQVEFEALMNQDLALAAQHSQLTGTARSLSLERRELARKGNQLRNIFVAALRHSLGPDNQQLKEFGIKPRVFRRKKQEEEPKPAPTAAAASTLAR
jgi:hypothetical protein